MIVLVVCHTILNDAFRTYPEPSDHQKSAKFFVRYLIEKQSGDSTLDMVQELDGTFVLRSPNGFKRFFRSDGRLSRYVDRFGNQMLFAYDARGNLDIVTDAYGREVDFAYEVFPDGMDRLVSITDFAGREVRFTYSANGDLMAARSPLVVGTSTNNDFSNGRTEKYTYSEGFSDSVLNHNLLTVTFPEEVAADGPPAMICTYGEDPNDPQTF